MKNPFKKAKAAEEPKRRTLEEASQDYQNVCVGLVQRMKTIHRMQTEVTTLSAKAVELEAEIAAVRAHAEDNKPKQG